MNIQILSEGSKASMFIEMENEPELVYTLLGLSKEYGIIQKYYWTSKFDESIIECIEPVIYDAYIFNLHVIGNTQNLQQLIIDYRQKADIVKALPKFKLSEEEIKEYASKLYGLLNIELCK